MRSRKLLDQDLASPERLGFGRDRLLQALLASYVLLWSWLAFAPADRLNWLLEHILVFAFVGVLIATYRSVPLSHRSYIFIFVFLSLHAMGAHYSYGRVPLGEWIGQAFGYRRNHFDRIMHFSFGFLLSTPIREALVRFAAARGFVNACLTFVSVLACGAVHEIGEWIIAETVNPEVGEAYLGAQGDFWDAQKDMLVAACGSLLYLTLAVAGRRLRTRRGPPARRRAAVGPARGGRPW